MIPALVSFQKNASFGRCLLKPGEQVHVLVRVDSFPYETQPVIVFIAEPLEIDELVDSHCRQVCCNGLEAGPKELQRVLEHEVFAKGEGGVLLHPLPNYLDLVSRKALERQADEVVVVSPEVVKKHGDSAGPSQSDVTPPMCCIVIPPSDMIVVSDLLLGAVEGFVADMAVIFGLTPPLHQVVVLEALLILVELHCLVRELKHVLQVPLDVPLPDTVLESPLELREGLDDSVADRERRLTLVVKRLVATHCMLVSGRSHHRLEVGVHHEGNRCAKSIHHCENALCRHEGKLRNEKNRDRIKVSISRMEI